MRLKHFLIALAAALPAVAQTSPQEIAENPLKAGGVYFAYPTTKTAPTAPPKGYKPFHISHYGRHGSRYLISDRDYQWVAALLHRADSAAALTPLGRDVMLRLDTLMIETDGRGGDLTPLGRRQHRGIAERMAADYPEVFRGNTVVDARSTLVPRCILSMDAFCERLKEINPRLRTRRDASQKYMDTLCYHSPESNAWKNGDWTIEYDNFERRHIHPDRLIASLFSDSDWVAKNVRPNDLMWGLYWIAADMQNVETPGSFFELFTPEELFDVWQCINYRFYAGDGNYPGNHGLEVDNAKNLLTNIIATADTAILSPNPSVALRFGHDGNLIPLAAILNLKDCDLQESDPDKFYQAFADFKIAPMAGNIQLIFFRSPKEKEVLVKFLHNEQEIAIPVATETFPFYPWSAVREYYMQKIKK